MQKRKPLPVYKLTLGALYIAVFALASNVPFFSAIQIIPGVPVTLQVFLVAMIGLTLGLRGGLATYFAVMLLTLCGIPLMSGGKGGPQVFVGPTSGYIYGWVFIIVICGVYSSSYYIKVVVFRVPLQELLKSCYTVMDAVDWFHLLPPDGFRKAPTTDLYEFVN